MEISKEKNLVHVEIDNIERTFDINTGAIYGKTGAIVKTLGFPFSKFVQSKYDEPKKFKDIPALSLILHYCVSSNEFFTLIASGFWNFAERLLKLPYRILMDTYTIDMWHQCGSKYCEEALKNKNYLKWLSENNYTFALSSLNEFLNKQALNRVAQKISITAVERSYAYMFCNHLPPNMENMENVIIWYIVHYLRNPAIKNHTLCRIYSPHLLNSYQKKQSDITTPVTYAIMCCVLKRDLATTDFYKDKAIVEDLYYNKLLAEEKQRFLRRYDNVYLFKNELFQVILPTSGDDLIIEGKKMHHCVGSYVSRVTTGECAIVFVRMNTNPDEPYITCEIKPDGSIGQYFFAYDRPIIEQQDKDFKKEYQKYLYIHAQEIEKLLHP